jgi:hypothetical protein
MPITPRPSWAPTISEPTAAPWPLVKVETPSYLTMLPLRLASPTKVWSRMPMVVLPPEPWVFVSEGVQLTRFIQWSTWSVPLNSISPS